MKVYTFSILISAALSIPSLVGNIGAVGSDVGIGKIGTQIGKLDAGKDVVTGIGKDSDVGSAVNGAGLGTVGETAGSVTRSAKGDLSSVKEAGGDVANLG